MIKYPVPSSSGGGAPTLPPPSKKRKADQLEGLSPEAQEAELRALRELTAAIDAKQLKDHVLKHFDDALASLHPRRPPPSNTPAPLSAVATSTSATSPQGQYQQRPDDDNRLNDSNQSLPAGPIDRKHKSDTHLSVINALNLLFSNLSLRTPTNPSASSSPSRSFNAPTSVGSSTNTMPSSLSPNSTSRRQVPSTVRMEDPSEEHCVRCHQDFDPSSKDAICMIEHDLEDCQRIAKYGQTSSRWKYGCCGYEFKSSYCDEPEDENSKTDEGQYCFVGQHTTIERIAHARKLNTYSCADLKCWEEDSDEEEMRS